MVGRTTKHPNYKIIKIHPRVVQVELSSSTNDYNPTLRSRCIRLGTTKHEMVAHISHISFRGKVKMTRKTFFITFCVNISYVV